MDERGFRRIHRFRGQRCGKRSVRDGIDAACPSHRARPKAEAWRRAREETRSSRPCSRSASEGGSARGASASRPSASSSGRARPPRARRRDISTTQRRAHAGPSAWPPRAVGRAARIRPRDSARPGARPEGTAEIAVSGARGQGGSAGPPPGGARRRARCGPSARPALRRAKAVLAPSGAKLNARSACRPVAAGPAPGRADLNACSSARRARSAACFAAIGSVPAGGQFAARACGGAAPCFAESRPAAGASRHTRGAGAGATLVPGKARPVACSNRFAVRAVPDRSAQRAAPARRAPRRAKRGSAGCSDRAEHAGRAAHAGRHSKPGRGPGAAYQARSRGRPRAAIGAGPAAAPHGRIAQRTARSERRRAHHHP